MEEKHLETNVPCSLGDYTSLSRTFEMCCLRLWPENRTCVFAFFVVAINLGSRWSCCEDDCSVDDFKVVRSCTVRCSEGGWGGAGVMTFVVTCKQR